MIRWPASLANRVCLLLGGLICLVVAAGLAVTYLEWFGSPGAFPGLVRTFSLDREANVPTWLSSSMLLVAAGLLGYIAHQQRRRGTPLWRHWLGLSLVFLAMSLDETACIHEGGLQLGLAHWLVPGRGFLYYRWVAAGTLFLLMLWLLLRGFLKALPSSSLRLFLVSGAIYVSGALGMEMLAGYYVWRHAGRPDLNYTMMANLEETLEMVGVALFIRALLDHIHRHVES